MNPKWPSIEEQLQAAKVTRGSALEKLIKDNQDFHLLQPEEAHDDAGIPLWLRVYWRKNHPDLQVSSVYPLGAYPSFLFKVAAYVREHHKLPWE